MNKPYKILGIDPGTNLMGYGLIEVDGNKMKLITLGVLRLQSLPDHQTKLKEIFLQLQEIIEIYLPQKMAIEAPFYGKNVQSMLKLGRAQGVAMAAGITMGMEIAELSPKRIKQSVTGNGNASKEQVAAMLDALFKAKITIEHHDATDALAAAVCLFNQSGRLGNLGKSYNGWKSYLKDNPKKLKA